MMSNTFTKSKNIIKNNKKLKNKEGLQQKMQNIIISYIRKNFLKWRDELPMRKSKQIIKLIIIFVAMIYAIIAFVNQQKTLNQYAKNCEDLSSQIEEQTEYKEHLSKQKEAITSPEFIEEAAREKLDMYLPNEKVYMDTGF